MWCRVPTGELDAPTQPLPSEKRRAARLHSASALLPVESLPNQKGFALVLDFPDSVEHGMVVQSHGLAATPGAPAARATTGKAQAAPLATVLR